MENGLRPPLGFFAGGGSRAEKITHAAEQEPPEILRRCEEWFDEQLGLDPRASC